MLKIISKTFNYIFYLSIRYEKSVVFSRTQNRAFEGSVINQKELSELYFEKNDIMQAFAWSYVSSRKGLKEAILLNKKYSEMLTEDQLEKSINLGEEYIKKYTDGFYANW